MAQIDEIKAKIKALRAETEANSITPDSLGLILDDMASLIGSQNSGPIGVASPYIDITLKIEQGNLVLYTYRLGRMPRRLKFASCAMSLRETGILIKKGIEKWPAGESRRT